MTLIAWIHEKLSGPSTDKFTEAIGAAEEFTIKVRSLRQQLEPYELANDPLAAVTHAHEITEEYRRRTTG